MQGLENENTELKQRVTTLTSQNKSLNTEKDGLLRQLAEVKTELTQMVKENKEQFQQVKIWKEKSEDLERQLFEARKTLKELEMAMGALESMKAEFPNQLKGLTEKFNKS